MSPTVSASHYTGTSKTIFERTINTSEWENVSGVPQEQ